MKIHRVVLARKESSRRGVSDHSNSRSGQEASTRRRRESESSLGFDTVFRRTWCLTSRRSNDRRRQRSVVATKERKKGAARIVLLIVRNLGRLPPFQRGSRERVAWKWLHLSERASLRGPRCTRERWWKPASHVYRAGANGRHSSPLLWHVQLVL